MYMCIYVVLQHKPFQENSIPVDLCNSGYIGYFCLAAGLSIGSGKEVHYAQNSKPSEARKTPLISVRSSHGCICQAGARSKKSLHLTKHTSLPMQCVLTPARSQEWFAGTDGQDSSTFSLPNPPRLQYAIGMARWQQQGCWSPLSAFTVTAGWPLPLLGPPPHQQQRSDITPHPQRERRSCSYRNK